MFYQDLVDQGLLKKEEIGFDQVQKLVTRAFKDLKSAQVLLKSDDEDGAYQLAYQAMLHAGRALVFSQGFKPRVKNAHKTVVECVTITLGKEFELLTNKFNRMRVKRHELLYEAELSVSETEANNSIQDATKLVENIKNIIQKNNPQQELF